MDNTCTNRIDAIISKRFEPITIEEMRRQQRERDGWLVLCNNPLGRIYKLGYVKRIDVCTNRPVRGPRDKAFRVSHETALTVCRNLRARGYDAAIEPANLQAF